MKKLLIILLLISPYVNADVDAKTVCTNTAVFAQQTANNRDESISLADTLENLSERMTIKIAKDVYRRTYLTPVLLSNYWMLRCLDSFDRAIQSRVSSNPP